MTSAAAAFLLYGPSIRHAEKAANLSKSLPKLAKITVKGASDGIRTRDLLFTNLIASELQ